MLALALLWWAWAGYAWLTSVVEPEEGDVRILLLVVMAALLVVALCVPQASGDRALLFALAYSVVALGHIALFLMASRDKPALRRSVLGFAIGAVIAMGCRPSRCTAGPRFTFSDTSRCDCAPRVRSTGNGWRSHSCCSHSFR